MLYSLELQAVLPGARIGCENRVWISLSVEDFGLFKQYLVFKRAEKNSPVAQIPPDLLVALAGIGFIIVIRDRKSVGQGKWVGRGAWTSRARNARRRSR